MSSASLSTGTSAPNGNSVGKEVLAFCTSCKMDLNHVVVAMQGDRIAKVQCRTCKKDHVFKAPKGEGGGMATKKKAASKKAADASGNGDGTGGSHPIEVEWERLMETHKSTPVQSYTMKGHFSLGDRLSHPTFGDGIVGKLIYPNKLEVIFRHDVKVLIHAGVQ